MSFVPLFVGMVNAQPGRHFDNPDDFLRATAAAFALADAVIYQAGQAPNKFEEA